MNAIKQKILEQAQRDGVQVTALREQVLDIVLKQSGVIKAYNVLSQMQQQSEGVVAPPTAYRALDFGRNRRFAQSGGGQRLYFVQPRAARVQRPLPRPRRNRGAPQRVYFGLHRMRYGG